MRPRIGTFSVLPIALVLLQMASAQIPQLTPFSADMEFTSTRAGRASHEVSGKMNINPGHMRMDVQDPGGRGSAVVITNFATKTTDTLLPEQHMYMEFSVDQAMAMAGRPGMAPNIKPLRDPNNPCANEEGVTCKKIGTETVNGRTTEHWQVTDKQGKVANTWIDQSLHFPIKAVTDDSTWQLTNIKEGEQPASLFEIPSGYQKMDLGQMMGGHQPQQ